MLARIDTLDEHRTSDISTLTLMIGLSRAILRHHYPSDLIIGVAIGAATALISFHLL
ncbi:MAG: phosphatase PAP2 family protein [Pseudomonadota bacterium]|nr:phosphatase PAP2 family protein [Pseudomonadota bacterium]